MNNDQEKNKTITPFNKSGQLYSQYLKDKALINKKDISSIQEYGFQDKKDKDVKVSKNNEIFGIQTKSQSLQLIKYRKIGTVESKLDSLHKKNLNYQENNSNLSILSKGTYKLQHNLSLIHFDKGGTIKENTQSSGKNSIRAYTKKIFDVNFLKQIKYPKQSGMKYITESSERSEGNKKKN